MMGYDDGLGDEIELKIPIRSLRFHRTLSYSRRPLCRDMAVNHSSKEEDNMTKDTNEQKQLSVCVFCGSSRGAHPAFVAAAEDLADAFVETGTHFIYGGGGSGLMGALAARIEEGGGFVTGIIPEALRDISGQHYGTEIVVKDMHERKRLMNEKCDAFVALPGGYGTMEELLEMITWSQLNIHSKPIIILNTRGFFEHFIQWIDTAIKEGFIREGFEDIIVLCDTPQEVMSAIKEYQVPEGRFGLIWTHGEQEDLG